MPQFAIAHDLYQLYYYVMRAYILDDLLRQAERQVEHSPLASVRELAVFYRASPLTVQRALRDLAGHGMVYSLPRKGYFWGREPIAPPFLPTASPVAPVLEMELDLQRGVFHPFEPLPSPKELARYYGATVAQMRSILGRLVDKGLLEREGRLYRLPRADFPSRNPVVHVVIRCDLQGKLLLDTDREKEFLRAIYTESQARGLQVCVVGYEDWNTEGTFLDNLGREWIWPSEKELLGVLISTWLLRNPRRLVNQLRRVSVLSVWWEHPVSDLPRVPSGRVAFFNLAFGETPGRAVGEHLRAQGYKRIGFLSPFHGSDWSRGRLRGLASCQRSESGALVEAFIKERWHSPAALLAEAGDTALADDLLKAELLCWLHDPRMKELDALVCVNDWVAACVFRNLGTASPYLVSFDHSTLSLANRLDSFAFNTEGMVRQMVYHLLQPGVELLAKRSIHEMVGRLVLSV